MRLLAAVLLLALATPAHADPTRTWRNVPAVVSQAVDPVLKQLRACAKKLPLSLTLIAIRNPKTGKTGASMPFPDVGQRGFTPEESCLLKTIPKIQFPDLPPNVDRVMVGYDVLAESVIPPSYDDDFGTWIDLASSVDALVDADHKKALAACDKKARTVRVILDLTHGKTRVWLPAWQFHSAKGDGSTPPSEQKVKACLNKALATWKPDVLPKAMAEMQLSITVSP